MLLGFTFGMAETMKLYQRHYTALAPLFEIDLARCTVKSDQGSPRCAFCARNGQTQLICVRCFRLSWKTKELSLTIGNVTHCWTGDEFASLVTLYGEEFRSVPDQRQRDLLSRTLNGAGFALMPGTIGIGDERRFKAALMRKRLDTRIPSTTNTLEASDRHLNEAISRRNPFWVR
jgi:hypothetical protein